MQTKDFKNPLNTFISRSAPAEDKKIDDYPAEKIVENQPEKIEFDYTKDTKEIKSKRVQLVMTPSMYKALKQRAKAEKTSVNDFVCQFLQKIL